MHAHSRAYMQPQTLRPTYTWILVIIRTYSRTCMQSTRDCFSSILITTARNDCDRDIVPLPLHSFLLLLLRSR